MAATDKVPVWMARQSRRVTADCLRSDLPTWIAHGWTCANEEDKPSSPKPSPPPPSAKQQTRPVDERNKSADPKPVPPKGSSK